MQMIVLGSRHFTADVSCPTRRVVANAAFSCRAGIADADDSRISSLHGGGIMMVRSWWWRWDHGGVQ